MYELIKTIADLELFAGANMRQYPFKDGYRPLFSFQGAKTLISGRIDLIEGKEFVPGSTGLVYITFIKGMINDDFFNADTSFLISEGGKQTFGKGRIVNLVVP